jgi:hypothetical protein
LGPNWISGAISGNKADWPNPYSQDPEERAHAYNAMANQAMGVFGGTLLPFGPRGGGISPQPLADIFVSKPGERPYLGPVPQRPLTDFGQRWTRFINLLHVHDNLGFDSPMTALNYIKQVWSDGVDWKAGVPEGPQFQQLRDAGDAYFQWHQNRNTLKSLGLPYPNFEVMEPASSPTSPPTSPPSGGGTVRPFKPKS